MRVIKSITKIVQLDCDDRRRKHMFYQVAGKVGTKATTLIWFVDRLPEVGEHCLFFDENDHISPEMANFNLIHNNHLHSGICDKMNSDGYPFVY